MTKDKFPHYWLCQSCAEAMGGVLPEGACTVMRGECRYCKIDGVTLIPWVDFNWPKDKQADAIAKVTRD
jgi:hypothetical protein